MQRSPRDLALYVFFAVGALVIALEVIGPFHWAIPLKPVPVLALAARLALTVPPHRSRRMLAALVLGAMGDFTLALGAALRSNAAFLIGMIWFLIGHIFYITEFLGEREPRPRRVAHAGALVACAAIAVGVIVPLLGEKAVPLAVYAAVLTTMAATASLRRATSAWVASGAALFVVSDGLIGVRLAGVASPVVPAAIFVTYFAAQGLLSEGWARDQRAREADVEALRAM